MVRGVDVGVGTMGGGMSPPPPPPPPPPPLLPVDGLLETFWTEAVTGAHAREEFEFESSRRLLFGLGVSNKEEDVSTVVVAAAAAATAAAVVSAAFRFFGGVGTLEAKKANKLDCSARFFFLPFLLLLLPEVSS